MSQIAYRFNIPVDEAPFVDLLNGIEHLDLAVRWGGLTSNCTAILRL